MSTLKLQAPGSKSMTQRALLIAALSDSPTLVVRPLDCDDSRYLTRLLAALGVSVEWEGEDIRVIPSALRGNPTPIFCGNAGTTVRFGACLSLLSEGGFTLDGDAHMRGRPIEALGDALGQLGVAVRYPERHGYPPIALEGLGATPSEVSVDASLSSQYASGLLMVAPRLARGLRVVLEGQAVSRPYLDMTVAMMRAAGAEVVVSGSSLDVAAGGYRGAGRIAIEPDWSGAAFLLACGRLCALDLEVEGLPSESLQGDRAFLQMMDAMWQPTPEPLELDLTHTPDLIAPLAAMAPFAPRPTRIRGAAHARVKECDRIQVLSHQLARAGVATREHPDGLDIEPLLQIPSVAVELDPHDDHRMAMAFGALSLRLPRLSVANRSCVSKSFPRFWEVLEQIREHLARR